MLSMLIAPIALSLAVAEPAPPTAALNSLQAHAKSIGFGLPGPGSSWRGASLAGSYVLGPNLALTLSLGGIFDRANVYDVKTTGTTTFALWDVALMPGLRYYFMPQRRLVPYVGGALLGTYERRSVYDEAKRATSVPFHNGSLSVVGRFGAEWFVVPQFSISGELGLTVDAIRRDYRLVPRVQTFSSQLVGSFYW